MTEIPGIIVPAEAADPDLDDVLEEVGTHEPLMTFPLPPEADEEGWSGAFDALIAAGLFEM